MELSELTRFNPWWTTGRVREALLERFKRKAYHAAEKELERRQATLIWGMNGMAGAVMTYQQIDGSMRKLRGELLLYPHLKRRKEAHTP